MYAPSGVYCASPELPLPQRANRPSWSAFSVEITVPVTGNCVPTAAGVIGICVAGIVCVGDGLDVDPEISVAVEGAIAPQPFRRVIVRTNKIMQLRLIFHLRLLDCSASIQYSNWARDGITCRCPRPRRLAQAPAAPQARPA